MDEITNIQKLEELATIDEIKTTKFTSEKILEEEVFKNIKKLWKAIFNEDVKTADRQFTKSKDSYKKGDILGLKGPTIDIFIRCESGNNYCVEVKNNRAGLFDAIGQILYYSVVFSKVHKMVIISTDFSYYFPDLIKKYNLPIEFILYTPEKAYLLKK